ncbi:MAG: hypothetical protein EA378_05760 [Phycisphaerales bacterium]|nr:MAG: hypothetical protein EA378_05760 [Phycisphaerales bacterium]
MGERGRDRVIGARVIRLLRAHAERADESPRASLAHYPRLDDRDHPARWEVPLWMRAAASASPWLASLCELYDHPVAFPASLSPDAGWLLHGIVRNHRPRVALEVGTFVSVSTHWIAGALAEQAPRGARTGDAKPVLHCFDDFGPVHKGAWRDAEMLEGRVEFVRAQLERAELSEFTELHPGLSGPTIEAARDELACAGGVDLAFIDGDHSTPGVLADFRAVEPVLNTGGLVILHDTFPEQCGGHEGGRALLDRVHEFAAGRYEKIDLYLQPLNYGLGLLRRIE